MLSKDHIEKLFLDLNAELKRKNIQGEIGLCGGAVMCLVFKTRPSTKDVDAIFEPSQAIRKAAKRVALNHQIDEDWLNDAAKGYFFKDPPKTSVMELSHLKIWAPQAEYMLAMKAISARFDSSDKDDILFLLQYLNLNSTRNCYKIIEKYYPKSMIPIKTQFLLEEIFDNNSHSNP